MGKYFDTPEDDHFGWELVRERVEFELERLFKRVHRETLLRLEDRFIDTWENDNAILELETTREVLDVLEDTFKTRLELASKKAAALESGD